MSEINLRSDQKKVLEYKNGKISIPSVPGAGKTFILSNLAIKLLEESVDNKILILTYMNSAVKNFENRIKQILLKRDYNGEIRFQVLTIHKFAIDILKDYSENLNIVDNYQVVNDFIKNYYLNLAITEIRSYNNDMFDFFIDDEYKNDDHINNKLQNIFVRTSSLIINYIKGYDLSIKDIEKQVKKSKSKLLSLYIKIFLKYQNYLNINSFIDYDDLLIYALKILDNSKITKEIKSKYNYVFEDEAQDSNVLQSEIINRISKNIVKVGDINQSIMNSFTSSDLNIFKNYCKNSDEVIRLISSGRSSQEIIDFANYFVEHIISSHPVDECKLALEEQYIKPVNDGEYPKNPINNIYGINIILVSDKDEEIDKMVQSVKSFINKHPNSTVGVLFPNNYILEESLKCLEDEKIKVQVLSDYNKENFETFELIGEILEYLTEPFNNGLLIKILKKYFLEDISENEKKILKEIRFKNLEDVFYYKDNKIFSWNNLNNKESNFCRLNHSLEIIKNLIEFPSTSLEKLLIYIGEVLNLNNYQKALIENITKDLKLIFKLNPKWSLKDLARELKISRNNKYGFFAKNINIKKETNNSELKVTLSTYHKSKGLEWDFVYLFGVNSFNFPVYLEDHFRGESKFLKMEFSNLLALGKAEFFNMFEQYNITNPIEYSKIEYISEAIRLLYVGITRAKSYLILSGCFNYNNHCYYLNVLKKYIEEQKIGRE